MEFPLPAQSFAISPGIVAILRGFPVFMLIVIVARGTDGRTAGCYKETTTKQKR